ncbi:oxidoreductase alpha (Molybdopterin) subunit domain protein [Burkholderia sp. ABCPW 111]|nr:oxidoreductase alpha (Molybdopterin) subunit domain protein [Burkholderia sp. ABCPW 111]
MKEYSLLTQRTRIANCILFLSGEVCSRAAPPCAYASFRRRPQPALGLSKT